MWFPDLVEWILLWLGLVVVSLVAAADLQPDNVGWQRLVFF